MKRIGAAYFQRIIILAMAYREAITNRVGIGRHDFPDHFINRFTEGAFGIFHVGEAAYDQPGQFVEFATSFQLVQHPVDVVGVFANVFDEQDPAAGIDIGTRSAEMRQ